MVLINYIEKYGYDCEKNMKEILKETQHAINMHFNGNIIEKPNNKRKRELKWSCKEVTSFYGNPNKYAKQINMEAIIGCTCYKTIMESQME